MKHQSEGTILKHNRVDKTTPVKHETSIRGNNTKTQSG